MRSGTNRFSVESGCVAASNGGVLGAEGAGGEGWALGGLCGGVLLCAFAFFTLLFGTFLLFLPFLVATLLIGDLPFF